MIKLARMLKLTRVFKASRVLKRLAEDILMSQLEMRCAMIKLWNLILMILLVAHWQACIWALVSIYMSQEDPDFPTWTTAFRQKQIAAGRGEPTPVELYITSLYWSMMTLTSIGYGDVSPENATERLLAVFYMVISGVTWTHAIGTVASIASTLNPSRVNYETTMDRLNFYMRERRLPRPMRQQLRDFLSSAHYVHQQSDDRTLLSKLSPLLQGTVAVAANKRWLNVVPFLRQLGRTREEREFIAAIAMQLDLNAFVSNERIPLGRMYILRKGMVVRMWRFLGPGRVWGEDFLLAPDYELIDHAQAVCLTFTETFSLSWMRFEQIALRFEAPRGKINAYIRHFRLKRALLRYMVKARTGKTESVVSYVARSQASGFEYTQDMASLEKKIDLLVNRATREHQGASRLYGFGDHPAHISLAREGSSTPMITAEEAIEQLATMSQQIARQHATQQEQITELVEGLKRANGIGTAANRELSA